jgi:hypothetical protein
MCLESPKFFFLYNDVMDDGGNTTITGLVMTVAK